MADRTAIAAPPLERQVEMLRRMIRIRAFEYRAKELFKANLVRGSIHFYIGEEAVAVGATAALEPDDTITSTHRGHGHCLAKGGEAAPMMAELMGKATGYCHGKGGSMHIADLDHGILGANGIVGGGIPIAVGAALGAQYLGLGRVAAAFFGDGAINQGAFHEAANLAAVWKLPVVFVCENNQYGLSMPVGRAVAIGDLSRRAVAYGFPGVQVDGNDVLAVYQAAAEAVARARAGAGPTLIAAETYRWEGHFSGDPLLYRTQEEAEQWRRRDPIPRLAAHLEREGILDSAGAAAAAAEVEAEMAAAVQFALDSPEPDLDELYTDVYSE